MTTLESNNACILGIQILAVRMVILYCWRVDKTLTTVLGSGTRKPVASCSIISVNFNTDLKTY